MEVSVRVTNIGSLDGAEAVQLYVHDRESSVQRPVRELKAFAKPFLVAGESQTVSMVLDKYALSFWSEEHGKWMAEEGIFDVILASSADPQKEILRTSCRLEKTFFWSGL